MLRNYIITAYRNLSRNKVYALLNVLGLALGIGCSIVIFKVVRYELSYDKHQVNYDRIYRIVSQDIYPDRTDYGQGVPHPLAAAVKVDYPDVLESVVTQKAFGQINTLQQGNIDKKFLMSGTLLYTKPEYFKIFPQQWLAGDSSNALKTPNTAIITASTLKKFYDLAPSEADQVLGEQISHENKAVFDIVGVIADPPENTNFPFEVYLEYSAMKITDVYFGEGDRWNSVNSNTNAYILVGSDFNATQFDTKLIDMVEKYHGEGESDGNRYHAQPLSDVHYSKRYSNYVDSVSKESLYALAIIAAFLVLTACINFINLATAQAANRSKEIGIRKAIGSSGSQIVTQFLSEIFLITLVATVLSLAIGELLFIHLESVVGYRLSLFPFTDIPSIIFIVCLLFIVTFFAGSYPSFLLSKMNTVKALKSKITSKNSSGGVSLRKVLVICQFAISQFMIVGTLIITAQMDYFLNADLGFNRDAKILTYLPERDEVKRDRFKTMMLQSASITDITFSLSAPLGTSGSFSNFNYEPLNSEDEYHSSFKTVDDRYIDYYELELVAGRKLRGSDSTNVAVINEKIADLMGYKDRYEEVLGQKLTSGFKGDKTVIGVMKNFHNTPLRNDIDFVMLINDPEFYYEISFKIGSRTDYKAALDHFNESWEEVFPEYVKNWEFYDEQLANQYEDEQKVSSLMKLFSIIAILIGCIGLYGLISFIALNKMKEIGVRKVLGASIGNILMIYSKEIVILLSIAFIVAGPGAFYLMDLWLDDFTYSINISPLFFIVAFFLSMLVALLTISHRTISSALMDPARTLKDE
ncbi:MAG: FtsX-like permease family protein [Cytophagales bacterium]|nr:FtsX-like permease family protein [Cytophagales bacterium]